MTAPCPHAEVHPKTGALIPCEPCAETACPDCEMPKCPGFGCLARRMTGNWVPVHLRWGSGPDFANEGGRVCVGCGESFAPHRETQLRCRERCPRPARVRRSRRKAHVRAHEEPVS